MTYLLYAVVAFLALIGAAVTLLLILAACDEWLAARRHAKEFRKSDAYRRGFEDGRGEAQNVNETKGG